MAEFPFKKASRVSHPAPSIIKINDSHMVGGGYFQLIAGPCSVESEEQMEIVVKSVRESGATMIRGGAFKPRTSPYSFQGLRKLGLEILVETAHSQGLPVVSEIMDIRDLPLFEEVDVLQVGARNMQNFELLKELGKLEKPILLKRGYANTMEEMLMSAEYILAGGNQNIILCERGIRTFEKYTRNTLDLSAVEVLHNLTHLPVIVDPSHATGHSRYVEKMAVAAVASGADGLMIEVHNDPENALSDGPQSQTPEQFQSTARKVWKMRNLLKEVYQ